MHGTTVKSPRPFLEEVADVEDECVGFGGHGDPGRGRRVPDLETAGGGLLEHEGDAAEVGVSAGCEGASLVLRWLGEG